MECCGDNSQKPSPKKQRVENTKPKQRKQSGKISSKKDKGISIARMQQYRTCMNYTILTQRIE